MNEWYTALNKPPLTPPAQYFPIAWGILYTLMAISFFIVLSKPHSKDKYTAVYLFLAQLMFNFVWSYVFFEMKSIGIALLDVIILLILVSFTIFYFNKISKFAAILMIPYLLQVIFATYLNAGIMILN